VSGERKKEGDICSWGETQGEGIEDRVGSERFGGGRDESEVSSGDASSPETRGRGREMLRSHEDHRKHDHDEYGKKEELLEQRGGLRRDPLTKSCFSDGPLLPTS